MNRKELKSEAGKAGYIGLILIVTAAILAAVVSLKDSNLGDFLFTLLFSMGTLFMGCYLAMIYSAKELDRK